MKFKILLMTSLLFLSSTLFAKASIHKPSDQSAASSSNQNFLSSPFPVYTDGHTAINHPAPGFTKKDLPTNNDYMGQSGCYIACYSHKSKHAVYPVDSDTYVMGQIRVAGEYQGYNCVPKHFKGKDIGSEIRFKRLCKKKIRACGKHCWAGGDTGGWLGVQP